MTSLGTQRDPGKVIISATIYPPPVVNYNFSFFPVQSGPNQVSISKPSYENSRGSRVPQSNVRQIGPRVSELWSDKQTDKQRLQLYIHRFLYNKFLSLFARSLYKLFRDYIQGRKHNLNMGSSFVILSFKSSSQSDPIWVTLWCIIII